MLPEWNLKIDTGRRPEGEDDPASSGPTPTFARRRKGKAAPTSQLEGSAGVAYLRQYEEQRAERVRQEQPRTGDLTGLSFALLQVLEVHQPQVGLDREVGLPIGHPKRTTNGSRKRASSRRRSTLVSSSDRTLALAGSTASNNSACPSRSRSTWMTSCKNVCGSTRSANARQFSDAGACYGESFVRGM